MSTPNRKLFTDDNVLSLPTKKKPYSIWDAGTGAARGLAILVQPTGTKTYRVHLERGRFIALGRVGETTLDEARDEARKARRAKARGEDPRQQKAVASKALTTFGDALETWNTDEQIGRKNNLSADHSHAIMKGAFEDWLNRPLVSITKDDIREALRIKRDDHQRPHMANRLHGHLQTFFRWCVREDYLLFSPMREMPKPFANPSRRKLDWYSGEEADKLVRDLWKLAEKFGGDDEKFIKLVIITGKRRGVVASMQWAAIQPDWFWVPPAGSRTKRNHPIPLPKLAQKVLTPRKKSGPVFGPIDAMLLTRIVRQKLKLPSFHFHGIRHIVETNMAKLKISAVDRDRVLDHAESRGSGAVYDQYDYLDEKRAALEKWCTHLDKIVNAKPVKRTGV